VPLAAVMNNDISQYKAVARLEVGTLDLRQSSLTKLLLSAIRAGGTDISRVSFTPLDLNLENGILKYEGLTMTVGPVAFGFGGQVRLEKEEYDLQITIPGKTLAAIHPSMSSVLGPNDRFVLPLTGTFDSPRLDTGAFVTEFATLALKATGRKLGNDAAGDILDKLFKKDGNPLDDLFKPKDK
jgi:hypothetical protein